MRSSPSRLLVLFAVLAAALPLLAARPVPFTDWPNHLARVHIGVELLRGDPFWTQFYAFNPAPVPNAALDIGIGALHWAGLDLDWAASLFLLLSYGVFVGGFCRLARGFGAFDATKPLLGSILFFTGPLMFGLVNYMLGLGVAFWLLAAWRGGGAIRRGILAVIGTAVLFYVHLLAAAAWVLVILCLEAPPLLASLRQRPWHARMVLGMAAALSAGLVFLALLAISEAGTGSLPRADGSNYWYPGHGALLATASWKGGILLRMLTDHAIRLVGILSALGLVVFALLAAFPGRGRLATGPVLAIAALALVVLALPEAAGSGSLLDYRLALVPFLLAAAALRTSWRRPLVGNAALVLLLAISLSRTAGFTHDFVAQQAVIRDIETAVGELPEGSILLAAFGHGRADIPDALWWGPPTEHLATRAVIRRVFVPTVFAMGSQQPVVLRPEYEIWRRTWQIRSRRELAAMAEDVRPLCASAAEAHRRVFLFVAYPSAFLDSVVDPVDILASSPAFRLLNICAVPAFAS
jgi:hypothetical protein